MSALSEEIRQQVLEQKNLLFGRKPVQVVSLDFASHELLVSLNKKLDAILLKLSELEKVGG